MKIFRFVYCLLSVWPLLAMMIGCRTSSRADVGQAVAGQEAAANLSAIEMPCVRPVRKTLRLETVQPAWIEAYEQTPIYSKVAGYVDAIPVDIGDQVETSQLLASLFVPELQEELKQQESLVAQSQAEILQAAAARRAASAAAEAARSQVAEAEAGIGRAEGQYESVKSEFARFSQLAAGGSVTQKLADETRSQLAAAEATLKETRAKVGSVQAMVRAAEAQVEKARADEAAMVARLKVAQANLGRTQAVEGYTRIHAPYAGRIAVRNVDRGHFVQPAGAGSAKPLFILVRIDTVRVFLDVPEAEAARVVLGATARVRVPALPGTVIDGKVTRTSWALAENRTLRTEIDLANPRGALRPGMYAKASVVLAEAKNSLVLPASAVFSEGGQSMCIRVVDGRVKRTPISIGLRTADEIQVTSGLGDDLVVQARSASLQDGQRIEPAK